MTTTSRVTTDNGADVAVDAGSTSAPGRTLGQRLASVAAEVGLIKVSGKNQFGTAAMSIGDVEDALRDPLAKAGLLTVWSYDRCEQVNDQLWKVALTVTITNADNGQEQIRANWIDVGSNPMAATSFARKGFYKALFHLAEEDDESDTETSTQQPVGAPAKPASGGLAPVCVQCEMAQYRSRKGGVPRYYPNERRPGTFQCNGVDAEGEFQNHAPVAERPLTGVGNAVQLFADGTPIPDDPT